MTTVAPSTATNANTENSRMISATNAIRPTLELSDGSKPPLSPELKNNRERLVPVRCIDIVRRFWVPDGKGNMTLLQEIKEHLSNPNRQEGEDNLGLLVVQEVGSRRRTSEEIDSMIALAKTEIAASAPNSRICEGGNKE